MNYEALLDETHRALMHEGSISSELADAIIYGILTHMGIATGIETFEGSDNQFNKTRLDTLQKLHKTTEQMAVSMREIVFRSH